MSESRPTCRSQVEADICLWRVGHIMWKLPKLDRQVSWVDENMTHAHYVLSFFRTSGLELHYHHWQQNGQVSITQLSIVQTKAHPLLKSRGKKVLSITASAWSPGFLEDRPSSSNSVMILSVYSESGKLNYQFNQYIPCNNNKKE